MNKTIILVALLSACTTTVYEPSPDATTEAPEVSCQARVFQAPDSSTTCSVSVTVAVQCTVLDALNAVTSAEVTATTDPSLDTGLKLATVAVKCGGTSTITLGGMPCVQNANGYATLNNHDATECGGFSKP